MKLTNLSVLPKSILGRLHAAEMPQNLVASSEPLISGAGSNLREPQSLEARVVALSEKVEELQLRMELAEAVSGQANVDAYLRAAVALKNIGKHAIAEYAYLRAFELEPTNPEPLNQAGVVRSKYLHDYDSAERYYRAALTVAPGYLSAIYNLACCHARRGSTLTSLRLLAVAILGKDSYRSLAAADDAFASMTASTEFAALVGDRSACVTMLVQATDSYQQVAAQPLLTQAGERDDKV